MDNPHEGFGGKLRGVAGQGFSVIGHDYLDAMRKERFRSGFLSGISMLAKSL
ncbi:MULTISPECIES: hypothetical protein [Brevibacillus]|uniref:hypothetical protein n=1 Tax=Brevibacillus TaxID=55080 RepID=UPI0002FE2A88|nr:MULTISPECIES: hypothetical protein [Brevibacillus]MCG5252863.1 hypothetical protein [Brevibacillus agri]